MGHTKQVKQNGDAKFDIRISHCKSAPEKYLRKMIDPVYKPIVRLSNGLKLWEAVRDYSVAMLFVRTL